MISFCFGILRHKVFYLPIRYCCQFQVISILVSTLRSQIEGHTRLLIFRKFSILPTVKVKILWEGHKLGKNLPLVLTKQLFLLCSVKQMGDFFKFWALLRKTELYLSLPIINIQEKFQLFCFCIYTNEIYSTFPLL